MRRTTFAIFIIVALLLLQSVIALGVSPSKKIVDFKEGEIIYGEITIINNQKEHFFANIEADGILEDYIDFSQRVIEILPTEERTTVPYVISLPDYPITPGDYETQVIITQQKIESEGISARFAIISRWILSVPLQGRAINASLLISQVDPGNAVEFSIPIKNIGTEFISSVSATVDIFQGNQQIGSVNTQFMPFESQEHKKLTTYWQSPDRKAKYRALATIRYDDREIDIERMFIVGKQQLILSNLILESFDLGSPAYAKAQVLNDWFEVAQDVSIVLAVKEDEAILSSARSASKDLEPNEQEYFDVFFPTNALTYTVYDLETTISHSKGQEIYMTSLAIDDQGAVLDGIEPVTGLASKETPSLLGRDALLLAVIVLLIFMNVYWFKQLRHPPSPPTPPLYSTTQMNQTPSSQQTQTTSSNDQQVQK